MKRERIYSSTKSPRTIASNLKISRLAISSWLVGCVDVAGGISVSDEEGDTTTGIVAGVVLGGRGGKANGGEGGQNRYRDGVMHCC